MNVGGCGYVLCLPVGDFVGFENGFVLGLINFKIKLV